jgi:hypothetical protein
MKETTIRLYDWLLKLFPVKDYDAHRSAPWGWFFRFDIHDEDDGSLYLRRFVLARAPFGSVYLHHIVRSDRDRCLHDHPWNSLIAVLWGGYREELGAADGSSQLVTRRPGSIRRMSAVTRHRVLLNERDGREVPAWTLFIVTRKVRQWGFWTPTGWVQWRTFLDGDREC